MGRKCERASGFRRGSSSAHHAARGNCRASLRRTGHPSQPDRPSAEHASTTHPSDEVEQFEAGGIDEVVAGAVFCFQEGSGRGSWAAQGALRGFTSLIADPRLSAGAPVASPAPTLARKGAANRQLPADPATQDASAPFKVRAGTRPSPSHPPRNAATTGAISLFLTT